jgi:putative ABC transport system permease protein
MLLFPRAMFTLYEDLRYSLRLIAGNRTVSLAVFLSLTLGIGASASMFGAADAFLFRPIQAPQTDRILRLTSVTKSSAVADVSYPDFDDLQKRATAFESIATARHEGTAIDPHNGGQSRITLALVVSGDFFRMLRLQPVLGRVFRLDEDQVRDRDAVAMISYATWQRDFAGSRDVVGKAIRVNKMEFTIIGVVPSTFAGINPMIQPALYVPRMMAQALKNDTGVHPLTDRSLRSVMVFGRLKSGASVEDARTEVTRIATQLADENPSTNRGQSMGVFTQTEFQITEDPEAFTAAMLLLLIGILVLGIACVNVVNLMLSTAPSRTRETAVRLAMGATRSRLIRQFVVESCVISAVATTAGLGVAGFVARFVRTIEIGSGLLPVTLDMRVDTRVALFAFAVGMASGILSGLIPALRCSRGDLNVLMRSSEVRVSRSRTPFRQLLVGGQVALAAVLLVFSGQALQSLSVLRKADPGFRVDNVLTMAFDPMLGRGFSFAQSQRFYEQLLDRVRKVPGVEAAGLGHHVPLGLLSSSTDVAIEGYAMPEGQRGISVTSTIVGDGYFDTLRIPLVRGRTFDVHDNNEAPKIVIINEAMAQKYWPGRDPLGQRIEIRGPNVSTAEIVGIARTVKYGEFDETPLPYMYQPLAQSAEGFMYLFVATQGDPAAFVSTVRNAVREIDANQPIYDIHPLTDTVRRQALWSDILGAQVGTGAGVIGLLLGVLGLYAMLAYSVSRRTREIGIRMAVGATSRRVSQMIVWQGLKLSIAGIVVGLILATALDSALPELSSPTTDNNPLVYATVVAVLIAVTLLSCYYPARRAARVDPNECLRCE